MSGGRGLQRRDILVLLGAGVLSLLIAEVSLRALWDGPSLVRDPERPFILRPDPAHMPGVSGPSRFEPSHLGLRSDSLTDAHGDRILALGGSSTECVGLDTEEAWPAVLQDGLAAQIGRRVWVGNAGMSGISSRHHVMQVGPLLEQVPDVDVVLMLVGVSDLLRGLRQDDSTADWFDEPRERVRVHYEAFAAPARPRFGPWWEHLELVHAARRAKQSWAAWRDQGALREADDGSQYDDARLLRAAGPFVDELPDLSHALTEYRRNLDRVIEQAERRGARVVLVTHPALWTEALPPALDSLLLLGEKSPTRPPAGRGYYSASALARGLRAFNTETLSICADHGLTCLDLAPEIPPDTTVFYDDVHFNEAGARAVAEGMVPLLAGVLRSD